MHPEPNVKKSRLRAFWDFFVLFGGISTASNLSRTQPQPLRSVGHFLFRPTAGKVEKPTAKDRD